MQADSIVAISAAVVALVQLVKWSGLKDSYGPIAVIGFSGIGVALWLFGAEQWPPARTDTWPIFAGWVAVALSAAGVFGFTRASVSAVTSAKNPPGGGAGSSATTGNNPEPYIPPLALRYTYPVYHDNPEGHPAFLTTAEPAEGDRPYEHEVYHLDGQRAYATDPPYECDSCGKVLDHMLVVDGQWVAQGKETAP